MKLIELCKELIKVQKIVKKLDKEIKNIEEYEADDMTTEELIELRDTTKVLAQQIRKNKKEMIKENER